MSENNNGMLLSTVIQFLDEIKFGYSPPQVIESDTGKQRFRLNTGITCEHGTYRIAILGDESSKVLAFYSISNLVVPPKRRNETSEFLTRVNYGLAVGNFELGFEDGEIRFKVSIPSDGYPLSYSLLRTMLYTCGDLMEAFTPAIETVIVGDATAESADSTLRHQEKTDRP